jgi:hypothetical protein
LARKGSFAHGDVSLFVKKEGFMGNFLQELELFETEVFCIALRKHKASMGFCINIEVNKF